MNGGVPTPLKLPHSKQGFPEELDCLSFRPCSSLFRSLARALDRAPSGTAASARDTERKAIAAEIIDGKADRDRVSLPRIRKYASGFRAVSLTLKVDFRM